MALCLLLTGCGACEDDAERDRAMLPEYQAAIEMLLQPIPHWEEALDQLHKRLMINQREELRLEVLALRERVKISKSTELGCEPQTVRARIVYDLRRIMARVSGSAPIPRDLALCDVVPNPLPRQHESLGIEALAIHGFDLALGPSALRVLHVRSSGSEDVSRHLVLESHAKAILPLSSAGLLIADDSVELEIMWGNQVLRTVPISEHVPPHSVKITIAESAPSQHPAADVTVPDGQVRIGGGCRAEWHFTGQFLTRDSPTPRGWSCKSKDHAYPDPGTALAYAVSVSEALGLDIEVFQATSEAASHAAIEAKVPNDRVVIGGGCNVDFSDGLGNMLAATHPTDDGWACRSQDHGEASPATLTAFALGMKRRDDIEVVRVERTVGVGHRLNTVAYLPLDGTQVIGGGCAVEKIGPGNLLFDSYPLEPENGWVCGSTDFRLPGPTRLSAYAIGLKWRSPP